MPQQPLLSPWRRQALQHLTFAGLDHRYTRTARDTSNPPTLDDFGRPVYETLVVTEIPCHYGDRPGPPDFEVQGIEQVTNPTLLVAGTDPIRIGDMVSNIHTQDGRVMVNGPIRVDDVKEVSNGIGGPIMQRVLFRETKIL